MIETEEEKEVLPVIKYDNLIFSLLDQYAINGEPIEVSFRELVKGLKPEMSTHLIHTYPAKLLMHIPHFFLNNEVFSKVGDTVLDPFSGSGTVMLESILAKRNAIGADANPLARLISKVKVNNYDPTILEKCAKKLIKNFKRIEEPLKPKAINVDFWFLPEIQNQLAEIFFSINKISDQITKDFFLVCFSNCVKKVSLADSRVSVPVRLNPNRYPDNHILHSEAKKKLLGLENIDVISKFKEIVSDNISRFKELSKITGNENYVANVVSRDARVLTENLFTDTRIPDHSIQLVITSPPYAGAQKYIRASSLSLGWLNLISKTTDLKDLDELNIGRENYKKADYKFLKLSGIKTADVLLKKIFKVNPLRAHIASNYLFEMRMALTEVVRVLKPNGYFVLVVGNNQVCGFEFETQNYLKCILEELGLKIVLRLIDDIQSYGLMTKRNKTANIITREWVLVFRKAND